MMIGRVSENQYSITIDSLPLTWAELPESTPLIQVLVECLNIESISQRKGKLATIKRILISEYKKSFKRSFYKLEHIFTTDNPDILNKRAVFTNFRGNDRTAVELWNEAMAMKKSHQDSLINLLFHRWKSAEVSDQEVIKFLEKEDSINEKNSSLMLKALFMIAVGNKSDGVAILKKVLQGTKSQVGKEETKEEQDSLLGGKETQKDEELVTYGIKSQVVPLFHRIQLEKGRYFQNRVLETDHSSEILHISVSSLSKFLVTTSNHEAIIWTLNPNPKKALKVDIEESKGYSVISCIDSKGTDLVSYRQFDDKIAYYKIDLEEGKYQEKTSFVLLKEFTKEPLDSLAAEDSVSITEIYFLNEGKTLR